MMQIGLNPETSGCCVPAHTDSADSFLPVPSLCKVQDALDDIYIKHDNYFTFAN